MLLSFFLQSLLFQPLLFLSLFLEPLLLLPLLLQAFLFEPLLFQPLLLEPLLFEAFLLSLKSFEALPFLPGGLLRPLYLLPVGVDARDELDERVVDVVPDVVVLLDLADEIICDRRRCQCVVRRLAALFACVTT